MIYKNYNFIHKKSMVVGLILFSIYITGCTNGGNTKSIDNLLFEQVKSVRCLKQLYTSEYYELSAKEIDIFRNSIRYGKNLISVANNILPSFQENDLLFIISQTDAYSVNMIYKHIENSMYVTKIDVHHKKKREYLSSKHLIKKYLEGTYRFTPSNDIQKIVSRVQQMD